MARQNLGLCNTCKARVPAEFHFRDGQVWIEKHCPDCGPNESLVSSDAAVWQAKRELWDGVPTEPVDCTLNCDNCKVDHKPNMVFLDVTNRCNMNCPICIATIRGMGFDFNPPLEYFDKIFAEISKMHPKPVVQLFGGEPTVRDDLLEIIRIARGYGLKPHVTTNGVRLADEEYCRKLCEARVPVRLGFDGRHPDIYERLRNNRPAFAKKMKALENLQKFSRRKHTIISCAAWGINDQYMADLIQYVHDNRDLFSDLGVIPLTENWEEGEFDAAVHTTMEDVEKMLAQAVPGGKVEFIPAGMTYYLRQPRSFFRKNPRSEVLLLAGVHPNCESFTILVSDGKTYHGLGHYLKRPLTEAMKELAGLCKKIEPKLSALDRNKFFQRLRGQLICIRTFWSWMNKTVDFHAVAGGNPVIQGIKFLFKRAFTDKYSKGRRPRSTLRLGVLPFEEQHSVDAARMESCKAVFAYEDTDDGKVKTIPACLWYPYRNALLEKLSQKYGAVTGKSEADKIDAKDIPQATAEV